ncbi:MAG: hypothetical protein GY756_27165 [bacterium]|nr:hypothetical protein [bacterium]
MYTEKQYKETMSNYKKLENLIIEISKEVYRFDSGNELDTDLGEPIIFEVLDSKLSPKFDKGIQILEVELFNADGTLTNIEFPKKFLFISAAKRKEVMNKDNISVTIRNR